MPDTDLQHLCATEFKRLCGVRRETFNEMVEVLRPQLERQGRRGGQNKLRMATKIKSIFNTPLSTYKHQLSRQKDGLYFCRCSYSPRFHITLQR